MQKKSYTIDPKEYAEDGLFHEADSFELKQTGEDRQPRNRKHHAKNSRAHRSPESLEDENARLRDEAFYLRRDIQKLKAYKRKVETYEAYYLVDLEQMEYICVDNVYGCKEAYLELKQDLKDSITSGERGKLADYSTMDTESLRLSKSYLVYSPNTYCGMDLLLEDMRRCRLERLGARRHRRTTIGCLLLNDGEYVFFWPKVLHGEEDDCSVDPTTDTQSKGL